MKQPRWLPDGYEYTPSKKAKVCKECGRETPEQPGRLRRLADGRSWGLYGNRSERQDREMIEAIIAAHPLKTEDVEASR